jgi:hypothetical protein
VRIAVIGNQVVSGPTTAGLFAVIKDDALIARSIKP